MHNIVCTRLRVNCWSLVCSGSLMLNHLGLPGCLGGACCIAFHSVLMVPAQKLANHTSN